MNTPRKRPSLGRGLSALLGDDKPADGGQPQQLPVAKLHPGRYQPRHHMREEDLDDLIRSVKERGVLQPLLVRPHPDRPGDYEIIAGERRWRAAQAAQLHEVPVLVRGLSDQEALEIGLIENLQREDLSPIDEALGLQRLTDEFGHTQEMLGKAVGKSRSHVANMLRLLALPDPVKALVDEGALSMGHARALLGAHDPVATAKKIIDGGMSVRQAEKLVADESRPRPAKAAKPTKDADTLALERDLSGLLGLRVTISPKGKAGDVTIHYASLDQLDGLLHRLSHNSAAD